MYFNSLNSENEKSKDNINSSLVSIDSYLEISLGYSKNIALKEEVVEWCNETRSILPTSSLNKLTTYNTKIDGVTLYRKNGEYTSSFGVSSPPSIDELNNINGFNDFINGDDLSFISIRNEIVTDTYNQINYYESNGIISIFVKVMYDNELVGILVSDIFPLTIYNSLEYKSFYDDSKVFLKEDKLLTDQIIYNNYLLNMDNKYHIEKMKFNDDIDIVLITPLNSFKSRFIFIFMIIMTIDIIMVMSSLIFSSYITKKVMEPINKIYKEMREVIV